MYCYDDKKCEEDEEEKETILHITECACMRDNMTIVGTADGHYTTTSKTVHINVQDGGDEIGAFDTWISSFVVGKRFSAVMQHMRDNMNCAFGSSTSRLVMKEMQKALPLITAAISPSLVVKEETKTSVPSSSSSPSSSLELSSSSLSNGRDKSEDTNMINYYRRMMDAFKNAAENGLFLSEY